MPIQNFPTALQPIIQQGFLEREFDQALRSKLGYRACADRVTVSVGIGETVTKTRAGLKPAVFGLNRHLLDLFRLMRIERLFTILSTRQEFDSAIGK